MQTKWFIFVLYWLRYLFPADERSRGAGFVRSGAARRNRDFCKKSRHHTTFGLYSLRSCFAKGRRRHRCEGGRKSTTCSAEEPVSYRAAKSPQCNVTYTVLKRGPHKKVFVGKGETDVKAKRCRFSATLANTVVFRRGCTHCK